MLCPITLYDYGKYLLLSGEVVWGHSDLVSYAIGGGQPAQVTGDAPVTTAEQAAICIAQPAANFSVRYNYTTFKTEFICTGIRAKFTTAWQVSSTVMVGRLIPISLGYILQPVCSIVIPFISADRAVVGKIYVLDVPDSVFFTI